MCKKKKKEHCMGGKRVGDTPSRLPTMRVAAVASFAVRARKGTVRARKRKKKNAHKKKGRFCVVPSNYLRCFEGPQGDRRGVRHLVAPQRQLPVGAELITSEALRLHLIPFFFSPSAVVVVVIIIEFKTA
jgi:hypothetical protein